MKILDCPIVGSNNTEVINNYPVSITSDGRLLEREVENRISLETGIIYNATGARNVETSFYSESYDLHGENTASEFQYFDQINAQSEYEGIVDFLQNNYILPVKGRVLDIGCGKGLLLRYFLKRYPKWEICAIEPSKNAVDLFKKIMPGVEVFNGTFEESPYIEQKFDLILNNGVLEHVHEPAKFLQQYRNCLKDNGVGYIGVPNFENNPADLFTFDHLTRFTPATIEALLGFCGFSVIGKYTPVTRVPMWFLISKGKKQLFNSVQLCQHSREVVGGALNFVDSMFKAYEQCANDVMGSDEKVGMYGSGAIGAIATVYTKLNQNLIEAIYDDNKTLWGSKRLGVTVCDPHKMTSYLAKRFVIAANPCYLESIKEKIVLLNKASVKIYIP